ncbi:hypothetical protein LOZ61_005620 [Ophidiomyces ophidiicola]|nr:hypothetical protein LOZ61_005620 [Ophidiomyces ophidiicola]KAI1931059.1 hypothetical protein LOZ60_000493 [Ophidiomyces ophidiicola]KAI1964217.1 hypothetical protein LOZ56_006283 [Ophidiomyces ophidiicola]KAI2148913.1 hypothetical protein LOZ27_001440 [Ophidiomyces ophidiicola]KAI2240122.1 hypothetical protein LOZ13_003180 [Ophidiomyces ophidiicola]
MASPFQVLGFTVPPRRRVKFFVEMPVEIMFMVANFLSNTDLANLRLVSKDFGWVEAVLLKTIRIRVSADFVRKAELFIQARPGTTTIHCLSFSAAFARPGVKGVKTWKILTAGVSMLISRGDVVKIQKVSMLPSSTEIIPFLNALRRSGVTTIKTLELHRFTEHNGIYARDADRLGSLLAGIEALGISIECWSPRSGYPRFMTLVTGSCRNLKVLELSLWMRNLRVARAIPHPLDLGISRVRFPQLRSLTLSQLALDWNCFDWPLFTSSKALETVNLFDILLQPTDLGRYYADYMPQLWPHLWIGDDWGSVINKLTLMFATTATQVTIWQPLAPVFNNEQFHWSAAVNLPSSPSVRVLGR